MPTRPDAATARSWSSNRARALTAFSASLVVVVCAAGVVLAFSRGAYVFGDWSPVLLGVSGLAMVVFGWGPGARLSRYQWMFVGLLAAQAVWTALSMLWAGSVDNAWEETNRTFLYLLAVALAVTIVRSTGARGLRWLVSGLLGVVVVVAVVILVRLGVSDTPGSLFAGGGRLNYPITYWNGLAAFLVMGFWLALGLANQWGVGETRRVWAQPILLLVSVVLAQLAVLPESRGALWALAIVVPLFVVFSPRRFRALTHLVIVSVPLALFWGRMTEVYVVLREMAGQEGSQAALRETLDAGLLAILYSVLIVLALWMASWVLERGLLAVGVPGKRSRGWIAVGLLVVAIGGAAGGLWQADRQTGGLGGYLGEKWEQFSGDQGPGGSGSRFSEAGLSGRLEHWRVALAAFEEHPLAGLGAQNYESYWYEHRATGGEVRQPHSLPLRLLAELGVPGLVLFLGFFAGVIVWAAVHRFRAGRRANQALLAAALTACLCWFVHASAEWLWHLGAVTLPVMLLLGGLLAVGPGPRAPESGEPAGVGAGGWGRVGRAGTVVACVLIFVSTAVPYLALRFEEKAQQNATGAPLNAAAGARWAARLNPFAAYPLITEAGALASLGPEWAEEVLAALEEAVDREPHDWVVAYMAGLIILGLRDDPGAARVHTNAELTELSRRYLEAARDLNPREPMVETLLTRL